jgi:hypothetical protein
VSLPRADCAGEFPGWLELPNPAGGRPRSLALPCASQVRELLPAICEPVLPAGPAELRFELFMAEGGLLFDSSCWRELIPEDGVELPGRPFIAGELCAELSPVRPGVKP